MIADVNNEKVQERLGEIPFGEEIVEELRELAQSKEMQIMMLEEKYAMMDWNSSMHAERNKGRLEGRAEGHAVERDSNIETAARNIMSRNPGMSYDEAKTDAVALLS